MTLRSMTGFGRATGTCGSMDWSWELRAVNGKVLDIRLRLPSGFERFEPYLRKLCSETLSRGNIQITLTLHRGQESLIPTINEDVLKSVLTALETIEKSAEFAKSTGAEILGLRGVMEVSEGELTPVDLEKFDKDLKQGFSVALNALIKHRAREGEDLKTVILDQIDQIETLLVRAESDPSHSPQAIQSKLRHQLGRLGEIAGTLDKDRLYQEVAHLATKSDIREELDRLEAHTRSAKELVKSGSPVGRKLEFLGQEFNRETNTLCSKSNSVALTEIGLELKVVTDQFREQILNVE